MVVKTKKLFWLYWAELIRHFFVLAVGFMIGSSSNAAEFRYEKDQRGQMLLFLEGPIEKGDARKFEDAVAEALANPFLDQLVLVLNSRGGSVSEAIEIGKLTRELLITTRTAATAYRKYFDDSDKDSGKPWGGMSVADGDLYREHPEAGRCWSACTIIFASGVIRQSVENFDKKNQFLFFPTIGVHRPKMPDEEFSELDPVAAREAHASMLKNMGDFLLEMGSSHEFVTRTMATPSHDIDLVSSVELESMLPSIEPFFEDWIAAKCGRKTDVLTPAELMLYQRAPGKISYADWGFGFGERDSLRVDYSGISDRQLRSELGEINRNVFNYGDLIRFCRIVTVKTHQARWLEGRRSH